MTTFNPYDPKTAMLLGMGSGLLQAGGWSPMPVGMGQALGQGMQTGMQSYRDALVAKRLEQQQGIEEGLQRARQAKLEREAEAARQFEASIAGLPEDQQALARLDPAGWAKSQAPKVPKAPSTRKRSLAGGMVQEEEFVDGNWLPVGEPYSRRDPYVSVQGVDQQGNPVTQIVPRADIAASLEDEAEGPELRRVTVGTGEKKRATPQQKAVLASAKAALADVTKAKDILFTPEGKLNRDTTVTGMAGIPGSEGRTGYQALRRAVEVLLRTRTGAAAPAEEVDSYMRLYAPSPMDSDEAARNKMGQLEGLFKETLGIANEGGFEWQGGTVSGELPLPDETQAGMGAPDIKTMPLRRMLEIDPKTLTPKERALYDERLTEAGY